VAARGSVPPGSSVRVGAPPLSPQCHYPAYLSVMHATFLCDVLSETPRPVTHHM